MSAVRVMQWTHVKLAAGAVFLGAAQAIRGNTEILKKPVCVCLEWQLFVLLINVY